MEGLEGIALATADQRAQFRDGLSSKEPAFAGITTYHQYTPIA